MESIHRDGKNNPYNGNFNNDNKTYLPVRMTTPGYEKTEYDNSEIKLSSVNYLRGRTELTEVLAIIVD